MPTVSSGSKASPVPAPAEPPSQKTPGAPVKDKKKETEVKTEPEKLIPEKETLLIEKTPSTFTIDQKPEESKVEKSKSSAWKEKKSPSEEEKPLPEDKTRKKSAPAEEKPPLEGKKPNPGDKELPPEVKPLALEGEEKAEILQAQAQIPEEPTAGVAAKAVGEEAQPKARTEDLPGDTPQTLPKEGGRESGAGKPPPAEGSAKSDLVEPGKEKTVSCISYHRSLACTVR